jgi:hypothetical protein
MLVVMTLGLLLAVGLVVDGGTKLRAVQRATAIAGEGARAAAQQVDVPRVQQAGDARLAAQAARTAALAALADADVLGTAQVEAGRVTVTATVTRPTIFLGLVGLTSVSGTGTATADLTID